MSKTFSQRDSRWGSLVYTRGGSTMAHAGCGATSMAEIIVNNPNYKDADPRTTRKWLMANHYNISGTTWEGITKGLQHFGFIVSSPGTMQALFDKLASGQYKWGILNFKAGSRGGVTWTSGGHYVAFTAYKYENGQHWLYTRDPGSRKHTGWFSYEKHMKGLIKKVWCCYLPDDKKTSAKASASASKTAVKKYDNTVIDISEHQGKIDWNACSAGNVIIRSSYTSIGSKFVMKPDKYFKANMKGAKGRKIGIYHFSQACSKEEARKEAQYVLGQIKAYKADISLPVAIDWEFNNRLTSAKARKLGKKECGKIIDAFCTIIKAAGYTPMVYANTNTLTNYLPDDLYKRWYIWVAEYNGKNAPTYKHHYYLWQYSSKGRVTGINGNVDMDKFGLVPVNTLPTKSQNAPNPAPTQKLLKVGARIKIKSGACQYGKSAKFASQVYKTIYTVTEINGSRVVFSSGKTVIGAVSKSDVIVQ